MHRTDEVYDEQERVEQCEEQGAGFEQVRHDWPVNSVLNEAPWIQTYWIQTILDAGGRVTG
jgi:hypothetical protein